MPQVIDRLLSLRVADVMARHVVTVSENQTMSDVAQVLDEHRISSAPVVDDHGHLVGVVSASDFVKRESNNRSSDSQQTVELGASGRGISELEDFAAAHMTSAVQSIDQGASLLRAARVMCAQHVHHLFVVDQHNQPSGIVSTMDVVAALVNVVNEMDAQTSQHQQQ